MSKDIVRCGWSLSAPIYVEYHDTEWGVPIRDDRQLLEHLILDGAQAGLSWITILKKRENYREAFHGFDPERVARYGERDVKRLLGNAGIVRNEMKIRSAINNSKAFLKMADTGESFSDFLWSFVDNKPIVRKRKAMGDIPATSAESDAMCKALKAKGFSFVGSTICYAFMQASGLVNDHIVPCFRHNQV